MTTKIAYTTSTPWAGKDQPVAVQRAIEAVNSAPVMVAAPHGIEDDGYADTDTTSRWIERIERFPA